MCWRRDSNATAPAGRVCLPPLAPASCVSYSVADATRPSTVSRDPTTRTRAAFAASGILFRRSKVCATGRGRGRGRARSSPRLVGGWGRCGAGYVPFPPLSFFLFLFPAPGSPCRALLFSSTPRVPRALLHPGSRPTRASLTSFTGLCCSSERPPGAFASGDAEMRGRRRHTHSSVRACVRAQGVRAPRPVLLAASTRDPAVRSARSVRMCASFTARGGGFLSVW
ncbi:hypothetical protein B0H17DRAFT_1061394 [Mycena rosella]|uniref:Uncharacterized protein n=1 Tax=Mycena rosella TaxID=1033263 RepID=A0AAD7DJ08_MYCRO|nr:hypothetical protein B0H17DRAFT_1061394 [Mycena rosella]